MNKVVALLLATVSCLNYAQEHTGANGRGNGYANGNGYHASKIDSYSLFKKVKKIGALIDAELANARERGDVTWLEDISKQPVYEVCQTEQGLFLEYQSRIPQKLQTPWGLVSLTGAFCGNLDSVNAELIKLISVSRLPGQNLMRWEPGETFTVDAFQGTPLDQPILRDPNNYLPVAQVAQAWQQLQQRYDDENK